MTNEEARDYLIGVRDACAPQSKTVDALYLAISALSRDRWISVEDELPQKGQDVIVYLRGGRYDQLGWVDIDTFIGHGFRRENIDERVVMWRPLPEPPKEET